MDRFSLARQMGKVGRASLKNQDFAIGMNLINPLRGVIVADGIANLRVTSSAVVVVYRRTAVRSPIGMGHIAVDR